MGRAKGMPPETATTTTAFTAVFGNSRGSDRDPLLAVSLTRSGQERLDGLLASAQAGDPQPAVATYLKYYPQLESSPHVETVGIAAAESYARRSFITQQPLVEEIAAHFQVASPLLEERRKQVLRRLAGALDHAAEEKLTLASMKELCLMKGRVLTGTTSLPLHEYLQAVADEEWRLQASRCIINSFIRLPADDQEAVVQHVLGTPVYEQLRGELAWKITHPKTNAPSTNAQALIGLFEAPMPPAMDGSGEQLAQVMDTAAWRSYAATAFTNWFATGQVRITEKGVAEKDIRPLEPSLRPVTSYHPAYRLARLLRTRSSWVK